MSYKKEPGDLVGEFAAETVRNLRPLAERKNPAIAFVAGLLFGAIGVAIYFKSVKDFFVCMGMFLLMAIVVPGMGLLLGWFFAPFYGAYRAHTSNEKLGV